MEGDWVEEGGGKSVSVLGGGHALGRFRGRAR